MRCEHCGGELVEVDNPMRREVRHRRGVACPRPRGASDAEQTSATAPDTAMDEFEAADDIYRRWE